MQVIFKSVGKCGEAWTSKMGRLDYSLLVHEIEKHSNLTKNNLDLGYDESKNNGIIYAGKRIAGRFCVAF